MEAPQNSRYLSFSKDVAITVGVLLLEGYGTRSS